MTASRRRCNSGGLVPIIPAFVGVQEFFASNSPVAELSLNQDSQDLRIFKMEIPNPANPFILIIPIRTCFAKALPSRTVFST